MTDDPKGSVPLGAYCTHPRMRAAVCECCRQRELRRCRLECPDCGLWWLDEEDEQGC